MTIDVLIVEDHPIVREGLRILLSGTGDMRVVGEASSGQEAVATLSARRADVVLLDLDLGGEDGLDSLPAIVRTASRPKVLIVTGTRDETCHAAARAGGASGVVTKEAPPSEILAAIRAVRAGAAWIVSAPAHPRHTPLPRPSTRLAPVPALTPREREIVALIAEGLRNAEIATRLRISEKTVRNHLSAVYDKFGVSDRLELLVHAYRIGLAPALAMAAIS